MKKFLGIALTLILSTIFVDPSSSFAGGGRSCANLLAPGIEVWPEGWPKGGKAERAPLNIRIARKLARGMLYSAIPYLSAILFLEVLPSKHVVGTSMMPGIQDGERFLYDSYSRHPDRGEVIILQPPYEKKLTYIKRVIGVPGDHVEIDYHGVKVNGIELEEPYVEMQDWRPTVPYSIDVLPDTYFVLGDNRLHSADSREFGLVPQKNILGKASYVLWPPSKIGPIQ